MLRATSASTSRPTRSIRPNTPVPGQPIGLPATASACSTVRPQLQRRPHPGQHGQNADAVADERRRVAGIDHFLAQLHGAELAQRFGRLRPGGRAGHQLQQAHVARRVEEMRDQEIGRKARRQAGGDFRKADAGSVGADDRARSAHALDPLEQRLLDRQALDHHLDDPVDLGQPPEILVEAAGADQVGRRAVHQRRRLALEQILLAALGRLAASGPAAAPARRRLPPARQCRRPCCRRPAPPPA